MSHGWTKDCWRPLESSGLRTVSRQFEWNVLVVLYGGNNCAFGKSLWALCCAMGGFDTKLAFKHVHARPKLVDFLCILEAGDLILELVFGDADSVAKRGETLSPNLPW
jgi:hypothetical protein